LLAGTLEVVVDVHAVADGGDFETVVVLGDLQRFVSREE
jgi:hypothetical protein